MNIKSVIDNVAAVLRTLTPRVTVAFAITTWLLLLINGRGWMTLPTTVIVSALVVGILSLVRARGESGAASLCRGVALFPLARIDDRTQGGWWDP